MTKFYWTAVLSFISLVCYPFNLIERVNETIDQTVTDTALLAKNISAGVAAYRSKNDSVVVFAHKAFAISEDILEEGSYPDSVISEVRYKSLLALNQIVSYFSDFSFEHDSALVYGIEMLNRGQAYYETEKDERFRTLFLRRIANTTLDVGTLFFEQSKLDSAISYYNKTLEKSGMLGDSLMQSKALLNLGMVYDNLGRYEDAIENYYTVIKIFEQLDDKKGVAITNLSLGGIYRKQGAADEAIEAYNKSLQLFQELDDDRGICACYNNLGIVNMDLENYDRSLEYYHKSLKLYQELGYEKSVANLYTNIAFLYENTGEYAKGIECIEKAMEINKRIGSPRVIMASSTNLAGIYLSMIEEDPNILAAHPSYVDSIISYAETGRVFADSLGFIKEQSVAVSVLKNAYALKRQYQKAYKMADLLVDLNDSIYSTEKAKIISEANAKFEAEQKELQIKQQQQQIDNQQLKLKSSKTFRNLLAIISLLMFIVLGLLYYLYKQKHKANKILDEKSKQIERQNREITRKRDELEEAYKKLNELLQFKEKMTGMIVHDLKNPVNNILNSHVIDDLAFREKFINQSGYDMLNLIQNILDLHKLEEAELEIQRDMIFLAPIVRQSIFELSLYIDEKNLKVIYPEGETDYFSADVRLLKRIFSNLLSNAVKYATDNSEITINSVIDDSGLRIFSVYNIGPAIPQDKQAALFDRFNQFDSRDIGNSASTGLGLAFCKMAVELHGGKIGVESGVKGTKFWFTLPG